MRLRKRTRRSFFDRGNFIVTLVGTTSHEEIDAFLEKVISLFYERFAHQLLSVYVSGSYANGYAVTTSDVDLLFVFSDTLSAEDALLFHNIRNTFSLAEPTLDAAYSDVKTLLSNGYVGMQTHCVLLWGEPVHLEIPNPVLQDYIAQRMHGAYERMFLTRKVKPLHWPLNFPNTEDIYGGYAWRRIMVSGERVSSLKEIVVLTGWMATAISAWRGQCYIPHKNESVRIFWNVIGGEIAQAFEDVSRVCRTELRYLLPSSIEEQQRFKEVLPKALAIENYFLLQYRDFLTEQLSSDDPARVEISNARLNEIVFDTNL